MSTVPTHSSSSVSPTAKQTTSTPTAMFKLKLNRQAKSKKNGEEGGEESSSVHRFSGNYSFQELDTVIGHLWGGSRPKHGLLFTYFDDEGDPVDFSTQEEWDECLKLHNQSNKGSAKALLRLAVKRADTPPPSPCNSDLSTTSTTHSVLSTSSVASPGEEERAKKLPLSFSELFHHQLQKIPAPAAASAPGTQPPSPTSAPVFNTHVDPLALPAPGGVPEVSSADRNTSDLDSASVYDDENADVEVVTESFDFAELEGVERVETGESGATTSAAVAVENADDDEAEEEEEEQDEEKVFEYDENELEGEDGDEDEDFSYEDEEQFLYEDPSIGDQFQQISDEMSTCRDAGKLDFLRACMSSLEDNKEEAIDLLLYAWAQGFYDPHKLKTDPSLENARAHPRFFTEVLPGGDAKEKMAAELSMHPDERQASKLKDEKVCNLLAMYPSVTTDGAAAALVAAGGDLQMACEILDGGKPNTSYSHQPTYTTPMKTNVNTTAASAKSAVTTKPKPGHNYRAAGGAPTKVVEKKVAVAPNAGKRIQYGGKKKKNLNRYAE